MSVGIDPADKEVSPGKEDHGRRHIVATFVVKDETAVSDQPADIALEAQLSVGVARRNRGRWPCRVTCDGHKALPGKNCLIHDRHLRMAYVSGQCWKCPPSANPGRISGLCQPSPSLVGMILSRHVRSPGLLVQRL